MANFCLAPAIVDKFKQSLLDGTVNPEALSVMTSAERNSFLAGIVGELNATEVNALFESKLLLKNQQQGMITWAKKVMGDNSPAARDVVSKIQRMEKVLDATSQEAFLSDLAAQKLGINISFDEAKTIADLSKKVSAAKAALEQGGDRQAYGKAVVELNKFVSKAKIADAKITMAEAKRNPIGTLGKLTSSVASNSKAIKASMDNSALFRQGWATMMTHPDVWATNAKKSFQDIWQTFGKDQVMDELNADIVSRPNSVNNYYRKAKLAVGTQEEAYPTTLPEKIPVLGKVYKASENAYTAFLHKTRADVFDKYIDIAKESGVPLSNEELRSIGSMVNSLTGRGNLGKLESSANVINNVFFSPRNLAAIIQRVVQPATGAGGSNFVRKQAAKNLLKMIMGSAAILGIAKAVDPKSVELDPRSSDFGKIRVGDTRFEVTGGNASIGVLASRLLTSSTKSSVSGKVSPLNSGDFGSQTGADVVYNFMENKLSPTASVVKDLLKGSTYSGEKPTIANEAANLFIPLPISNTVDNLNNENSANIFATTLADALGISTNTFSKPKKKLKQLVGQ
jgi:hypothetical protein